MQGPWMEWLMLVDEIRGQRLVQKMEEEEEVSVEVSYACKPEPEKLFRLASGLGLQT